MTYELYLGIAYRYSTSTANVEIAIVLQVVVRRVTGLNMFR